MAATDDRNTGTNAGRIQGQIAQISNWMDGADFEHVPGNDLDRLIAQVDWRSEIDPTLSASANYQRVKDKLGLKTATDIKEAARTAVDQAEQSARRAIRENLAAIEAGDPDDILADVEAEYGAEFAEAELERARADADAELGGAPEPKAWSPSAVGASATEPPEPTPEPSPARDSESGRESLVPPADVKGPTLTPTPKPTPTDPGREFVAPELPAPVRAAASAVLAPVKLLLVVAYVLATAPVDATDPEVAGHV